MSGLARAMTIPQHSSVAFAHGLSRDISNAFIKRILMLCLIGIITKSRLVYFRRFFPSMVIYPEFIEQGSVFRVRMKLLSCIIRAFVICYFTRGFSSVLISNTQYRAAFV